MLLNEIKKLKKYEKGEDNKEAKNFFQAKEEIKKKA